jgi:hypothetical protein
MLVSRTVAIFFYLGKIEKEGLFFIFDGFQLNVLLCNLID